MPDTHGSIQGTIAGMKLKQWLRSGEEISYAQIPNIALS